MMSVVFVGFISRPPAVGVEPPIDPQIARVIAATKAIDNHAHPMRATAEGEEDTDWDQIPSDVESFTLPVRLRPDNPERLAAWRALRCRDGGRIDLRSAEDGQPHFIEVNPLAGLNPERSDLVFIARFKGIEYRDLIGRIMESFSRRHPGLALQAIS